MSACSSMASIDTIVSGGFEGSFQRQRSFSMFPVGLGYFISMGIGIFDFLTFLYRYYFLA